MKALIAFALASIISCLCYSDEKTSTCPCLTPELLRSAEAGDAESQLRIGQIYGTGICASGHKLVWLEQDKKSSYQWYEKAAKNGSSVAMFILGCSYEYGEASYPINPYKAYEWYCKAAISGNTDCFRSAFNLMSKTGNPDDRAIAMTWLIKCSDSGHKAAADALGDAYYFGTDIPRNYEQAFEYYKRGSRSDEQLFEFCEFMEILHSSGSEEFGIIKDLYKSASWTERLAKQGSVDAQYRLGLYYYTGKNRPQNFETGHYWLLNAANSDNPKAQLMLGRCYGDGYGVTADAQEGLKWRVKAADQGLAEAQYEIGNIYSEGEGIAKNSEKAVEWYQKAVNQGYAPAQHNLGLCYYMGTGVRRDWIKAFELYKQAAMKGIGEAQYKVAACYYDGAGVIQDYVEAYAWMLIAGKQGYGYPLNNILSRELSMRVKVEGQQRAKQLEPNIRSDY